MSAAPHPISIRLTAERKDALERYRATHGLRSLNEAVARLIDGIPAPAERVNGRLDEAEA